MAQPRRAIRTFGQRAGADPQLLEGALQDAANYDLQRQLTAYQQQHRADHADRPCPAPDSPRRCAAIRIAFELTGGGIPPDIDIAPARRGTVMAARTAQAAKAGPRPPRPGLVPVPWLEQRDVIVHLGYIDQPQPQLVVVAAPPSIRAPYVDVDVVDYRTGTNLRTLTYDQGRSINVAGWYGGRIQGGTR